MENREFISYLSKCLIDKFTGTVYANRAKLLSIDMEKYLKDIKLLSSDSSMRLEHILSIRFNVSIRKRTITIGKSEYISPEDSVLVAVYQFCIDTLNIYLKQIEIIKKQQRELVELEQIKILKEQQKELEKINKIKEDSDYLLNMIRIDEYENTIINKVNQLVSELSDVIMENKLLKEEIKRLS